MIHNLTIPNDFKQKEVLSLSLYIIRTKTYHEHEQQHLNQKHPLCAATVECWDPFNLDSRLLCVDESPKTSWISVVSVFPFPPERAPLPLLEFLPWADKLLLDWICEPTLLSLHPEGNSATWQDIFQVSIVVSAM